MMVITQLYIQRDIRGYTPAGGDLAYPDKLIVTASIQDKDKSHSDSDSVFASGTEVRCMECVCECTFHEGWEIFLLSCCLIMYVHTSVFFLTSAAVMSRVMHLVTLRALLGVERK